MRATLFCELRHWFARRDISSPGNFCRSEGKAAARMAAIRYFTRTRRQQNMARKVALNKNDIVSGEPLPFSVFDPDRNLLLAAKGQVVTELMRQTLLSRNVVAIKEDYTEDTIAVSSTVIQAASPLLPLRLQYSKPSAFGRYGFRISREDGGADSYACNVVGVSDRRGLILSAPVREDGSYVAITEGQSWVFRTFYATTAIRFVAQIGKLIFDPYPYFHVEVPASPEVRQVRKVQRASTLLDAMLEKSPRFGGLIVDLSATGMRLALDARRALQLNERFKIKFHLSLLGKLYPLLVEVSVKRILGAADRNHPDVHFYGLMFETQTEHEQLLVHAYVQDQLVQELDGLSRVLSA
jgi:Flagellar protein YcgR/PilZ domain